VRHRSENTLRLARKVPVQQYVASVLSAAGWTPDSYELGTVPGLYAHPVYVAGRDYAGRPNIGARRVGAGKGRSLILSGHIDTVRGARNPGRATLWRSGGRQPALRRGSNDMKAGVAMNLFVVEALEELKVRLAGDLIFETVVDEEFGGVNGTLAGRVRGYIADAAVISEPSFLRICAAQRGGRTAHITFSATGGILNEGGYPAGVVDQLTHFLVELRKFSDQRRRIALPHPLYAHSADPVPSRLPKSSPRHGARASRLPS